MLSLQKSIPGTGVCLRMGIHPISSSILLVLCVFYAATVAGQTSLSIADLPPCGVQCLLSTLPASGCGITDTVCQCGSNKLAQDTSACMLANCTMADSLQTAKVQASLCNLPNPDRSDEMIVYTAAVLAIAVFFVILRLIGKYLSNRLAKDDIVLVGALLLAVLPATCTIAMSTLGFGRHLWDLEDGRLLKILRFFFIGECAYVVVLGIIKISLIVFYLQIFVFRSFQIAAYIILGFVVTSTLTVFFLTLFACSPVESFWNKDVKGRCLDINALAYANGAVAIVGDIAILATPMASLHKLHMKLYRKFLIAIMFSVGSFGCITSIIRLRSLLVFGNSIDPTWDYVPVVTWTTLELGAGFVCACLPSVRILFAMLLPKKLLTSRGSDPSYNTPAVELSDQSHSKRRHGKSKESWQHIPEDIIDEEVRRAQSDIGIALPRRTFQSPISPSLYSQMGVDEERMELSEERGRGSFWRRSWLPPLNFGRDSYFNKMNATV
ncbi:hypothetical protein K469DRAFT_641054 [Zopfia rhizophila CBS 207.26]|uniref:CFEM domain-containing protein n=1 Tax=Zopfia rhizophila CBS 207.26 TaxID=1314779 RepID=A0A6A6DKM7_9PEZI|nr:hypothetical protein K469DRAFT_641054 [Zopfia rhizophila CBS 207.26]